MLPLTELQSTAIPPSACLAGLGSIFATFGSETQDSGNISYGVTIGADRFFVKTAGPPEDPGPCLVHTERVEMLRNAVALNQSCRHSTLPPLRNVIESPHGPMLVYSWADGELLRVPPPQRSDPQSSFQRFKQLPISTICDVLDQVYELHVALADAGWIAMDFYDGCLIFDFASSSLHVVDLDMYRQGSFVNERGRMFGSSRFMAPEEFEKGSEIDERTNVFTMGRAALIFLSDGSTDPAQFRGAPELFEVALKACLPDPDSRFDSLEAFCHSWSRARAIHGAIQGEA